MQHNTNCEAPRCTTTFSGIKITLIVLQLLQIIGSIYIIAIGFYFYGLTDDLPNPEDQQTASTIIVTTGVIGLLVAIPALFATIKENYCLVVTYGVICVLLAVFNFVDRSIWYGVLDVIEAIIAFYFAYLINRIPTQNMA